MLLQVDNRHLYKEERLHYQIESQPGEEVEEGQMKEVERNSELNSQRVVQ